jgi:ribosomal protein L37AE/L43A
VGEGDKRRTEAIVELDKADAWLERKPDGALVGRGIGPGRVCSHCQGASKPVGEGVWRCEHCNREAFAKLPDAVELAAARRKLSAVATGKELPRTRKEMWKAFVKEHGAKYLTARRRLLRTMAFYFGCALLSELGYRTGNKVLMAFPLMGMCLSVLVLLYFLTTTSHAYFKLRFESFGPGVDTYDRALLGEIVACVALQGRIKRQVLAERLAITAEHLDVVLARFDALGGVPLLRDRKRDELVSLCAVEIGDKACPACGGELQPARQGAIACGHCQVRLVVGTGHVAPHGALASSPSSA